MEYNLIEVLDDTAEQAANQQLAQAVATARQNSQVKIIVAGVGGGGCNAVKNLKASGLAGVTYLAINTDADNLYKTPADAYIQLGASGNGAGTNPTVARDFALAQRAQIEDALLGADMVFITAGLGKGTGSGAAAVVADIAKSVGALTVAVVTKPFSDEGVHNELRAEVAAEAIGEHADTLITVLNSQLEEIYPDAFHHEWMKSADDVSVQAVGSIVEIIHSSGAFNVDFNDVRTIIGSNKGKGLMGTGRKSGENRAAAAAYQAMHCQLLESHDVTSARAVLINITVKESTLRGKERGIVINAVRSLCAPDIVTIIGLTYDDRMGDDLQVTLIMSGIGSRGQVKPVLPTEAASPYSMPQVALRTGTDDEPYYPAAAPTAATTAAQQTGNTTPTSYHGAGYDSIPTLTQMLSSHPSAGSDTLAEAELMSADTVTMFYHEPSDAAQLQAEKEAQERLQKAQIIAELASFQPKGAQRQEPSLMSKMNYGHVNRQEPARTSKPSDGLVDLEIPTFLRKNLAD